MSRTEELDPRRTVEDQPEVTLRPKRLAEFIGQEKIKRNLDVFLEAAKQRQERM